MKCPLLSLFTLFPFLLFGQTTLIPDVNFENALITLGYDAGTPDGSVLTTNINTLDSLDVTFYNISDLTGIEDFIALTSLNCSMNWLTSIDLSSNTALTTLNCGSNQLTSLDVSLNSALTDLSCYFNQLTSLDVSQNTAIVNLNCEQNQFTSLAFSNNIALADLNCLGNQLVSLDVTNNTALIKLECTFNQLTSLDLSNNTSLNILECSSNPLESLDLSLNTALTELRCANNQLSSLDLSQNSALAVLAASSNPMMCLNMKNGNNQNMTFFGTLVNPNLVCIEVDDTTWANANWTVANSNIDSTASFSSDCNYQTPCVPITTEIEEYRTSERQLLLITDLLGRVTLPRPNQVLIYKYKDGSVQKRIILE